MEGPDIDGLENEGPDADGPDMDGPDMEGPDIDGPEAEGAENDPPIFGIACPGCGSCCGALGWGGLGVSLGVAGPTTRV